MTQREKQKARRKRKIAVRRTRGGLPVRSGVRAGMDRWKILQDT